MEGDLSSGRPGQKTDLAGVRGELEVLQGAVFETGRDTGRKVVLVVGPVGCHEIPDLDGVVRRRNPRNALPAFETLGDVFHGLSIPFPGGTLHRREAFFRGSPSHTHLFEGVLAQDFRHLLTEVLPDCQLPEAGGEVGLHLMVDLPLGEEVGHLGDELGDVFGVHVPSIPYLEELCTQPSSSLRIRA